MKRILLNLMFLFVLACTPVARDAEDNDDKGHDSIMEDDMIDKDMMEEDKGIEDDSLSNRDMLAAIIVK